MSRPRGPSPAGMLATLAVMALAVLCCAGPILLAAGVLSGLGGVLRNPWLITIGAVLIAGSLLYTLGRHSERRAEGRHEADSCGAPPARPKPAADNHPARPDDPGPRAGTSPTHSPPEEKQP